MLLFYSILRCSNEIIHYVYEATPMKCLILEDTSGQLKLEGWLHLLFLFFRPFLRRRHHFIGNYGEEASFYGLFEKRRHHFIW